MSTEVATGLLLIVLPIAHNVLYTLLARSFDYPDILRQPTTDVLKRLAAGRSRLVFTWWGFAMIAVLLAPAVVLLSGSLADANPTILALVLHMHAHSLYLLHTFKHLTRFPTYELHQVTFQTAVRQPQNARSMTKHMRVNLVDTGLTTTPPNCLHNAGIGKRALWADPQASFIAFLYGLRTLKYRLRASAVLGRWKEPVAGCFCRLLEAHRFRG